MRKTIRQQLLLPLLPSRASRLEEYGAIDEVLDAHPELAAMVQADLVGEGVSWDRGREGIGGGVALRCMVIKQANGYSYEELEFELASNMTYRVFCRLEPHEVLSRSALHRALSAIRAETWEAVNRILVKQAADDGLEDGTTARIDTTRVPAAVQEPSDSKLLWDCVRVLTRTLELARRQLLIGNFKNRAKEAKRLFWRIYNAKRKEQRRPLYEELLAVTEDVVNEAWWTASELDQLKEPELIPAAEELAARLRHVAELAERVERQTKRRVLRGETVPVQEKVLSIFELHIDLLAQGQSRVYGHKVTLVTGRSGLVLDVVVEKGNPADATLATKTADRLEEIYDRTLREAVFDGGFASRDNLDDLKGAGLENVVFTKAKGIPTADMAVDKATYTRLRNFRAGIEGNISHLKRSFGLDRVTWSGLPGFESYVWGSVVASNLLRLARLRLAKKKDERRKRRRRPAA